MLTEGEYKNIKTELEVKVETLVKAEVFLSENFFNVVMDYSRAVTKQNYRKSIHDFIGDYIEEIKKDVFDNNNYDKYLMINPKDKDDVDEIKEYQNFHNVEHKGKYKKKTLAF
tara:strand:- start:51 stop:389 length:339 start_codon:yes stop_codon:yes gene_type:complete